MPTKKRELYPSDKLDQYIVRFPEGMRDRIKQAAADNNRSMNAEIIARLEASFDRATIETIDVRFRDDFIHLIEKQKEVIEQQSAFLHDIVGKMTPEELREVATRLTPEDK